MKIDVVEIFKTNVENKNDAKKLVASIKKTFPLYQINFDLEDCDKILRVKGDIIQPNDFINLLAPIRRL